MLAATLCQFARADVVFLVDSSRSICGGDTECSNWRSILNFVISIVNQLNIGSENTRVGFIRYSSRTTTSNEFYLNSNQFDRNQVTNAISAIRYNTGSTFVGDLANAFQVARTQQFVSNRGERIGAEDIIIVLMNGGVSATSSAVSTQSIITVPQVFIVFICLLYSHIIHCI